MAKQKPDSKVVVGGESFNGAKLSKRFKKQQILKVIIILTILLLVSGAIYMGAKNKNNQSANQQTSTVDCTTDNSDNCQLLRDANKIFVPDSSKNLKKQEEIATKIQQMPDFENNVNYLLILTRYYIYKQDAENARKYYDLLSKKFKSIDDYDNAIGAIAKSPSGLKTSIEFLEKQTDVVEKNSFQIEEPKQ